MPVRNRTERRRQATNLRRRRRSTTRGLSSTCHATTSAGAVHGRCLINDHARRWTGRELELLANVGAVAAEYAVGQGLPANFDIAAVIAGEAVG